MKVAVVVVVVVVVVVLLIQNWQGHIPRQLTFPQATTVAIHQSFPE